MAGCCGGSALVAVLWMPDPCLEAHPALLSSLFGQEPDRGDTAEPSEAPQAELGREIEHLGWA